MATHRIAEPDIAGMLRTAAAAQRSGNMSQATTLYWRVLELAPDQPIALNALGMIALSQNDAAAVDWFERAIIADPQAVPLHLNLATAHRKNGDEQGEQRALEATLALDQRNIMANFRLAELLDRSGREAAAITRWHGLSLMLGSIKPRSPQLDDILAKARQRLAGQSARLGTLIDRALSAQRDGATASEQRRVDACVDAMLGRRRIYNNECHGLHFPFLPADEFFDRANFPWMPAIEAETDAIRAELETLLAAPDSGFAPYVDMAPGSPVGRWTPLDGSPQWSARYLWRYGQRDDEVCARCPRTAAALEAVPRAELYQKAPTAFFSVLKPGTRLPPHSGVSNVRAIVHLPLIVPDRCGLRVGGETREWQVGTAMAFDDTIEHEAWNESEEVRAVLIFDVWNPHLTPLERDMIRRLFETIGEQMPSVSD
ncbi:aspartyl/asparaginyl beta-hydroxylase domain-containing protein [Sphingomonas sp. RHCKR47]|nr:aspartyl/asparaginyl beta-hydroxylase domain-containing protein [Sphingomonas citricola]